MLNLTYGGAIEPQLFAPVTLYITADNQLMVDGYEVNGRRVRWRSLELSAVHGVGQALKTYTFLDDVQPRRRPPTRGEVVLAQVT